MLALAHVELFDAIKAVFDLSHIEVFHTKHAMLALPCLTSGGCIGK